ncbi:phosphopantetheine adenylyltransferase, putative (PPAT) [Plasmodium ovale curtisi]|uniref:Phosphopantetheine adenylyltransferase, putative (PPAT) n=1 Tax=Plasmodium ovale curtisi TaxID=864141 RepID=A0A1A8VHG6_PLAOA|nr:phosphopantetheine adenylyltransferase, putative (PPAT) [Plasmodium ovale curtisi]
MGKNLLYENGFLIFEDYNFVVYTKRNGKRISWQEKRGGGLTNFNLSAYLYKPFRKYNFSLGSNNINLRLNVEKELFEKVQKNVKQLIKQINKLKTKVTNVYLFIKFISSKCILKMSTFYYLKYIIEKIYEKKLEKIVRVVLPISDLHKLYSYIHFEHFSFQSYYEDVLSKHDLSHLKRCYCSFIIVNDNNINVTQSCEKLYGSDIIITHDKKEEEKERKGKKERKERKERKEKIGKKIKQSSNKNRVNIPPNDENKQKVQGVENKKRVKNEDMNKEINMENEGKIQHNRKREDIITRIKIQKYKIKRTVGKKLNKHDIGLFAGTFDKIHFGHTLLLFYSIFLTNKFFYIGLYNNKNIYKKKYAEEIDDLKLRIFHISNILFLIKNIYHIHFFFYNFEHIMPFIKTKNSHKILHKIVTSQKIQSSMESNKKKYEKYTNPYYHNEENKKRCCKISKCIILRKKYIHLIKINIENALLRKIFKEAQINQLNKLRQKIFNHMLFHINSKRIIHKGDKKIIVLKRIHDPYSFAVDIADMYCLTMSKESEPNGHSIVRRRKLLFNAKHRDTNNGNGNDELIPNHVHNMQNCSSKDNVEELSKQNRNYDGRKCSYKTRTSLNIFDTIDIGDGEKLSSTLVRQEISHLKKTKFAKFLTYFIDACLFFNIEQFLIQMYIDIFLHKCGKMSFKKLYIYKIKDYFCKEKRNKAKKKKSSTKEEKKNNFIVNDFFRHLFVLLSFFVNHFASEHVHNKILLFMKVSVSFSFFFYNNMILLIIKRKEQQVNDNFTVNHKNLERKIGMFNRHDENLLRVYLNNIERIFLQEIINQVLIFVLLMLSASILCKVFHSMSGGKEGKADEVNPKGGDKPKHVVVTQLELEPKLSGNFLSVEESLGAPHFLYHEHEHEHGYAKGKYEKGPFLNVEKKLYKTKKCYREEVPQCNHISSDSHLTKVNYFKHFSNLGEDGGSFQHNSILTPYALCNYALLRGRKSDNFAFYHQGSSFSGCNYFGEFKDSKVSREEKRWIRSRGVTDNATVLDASGTFSASGDTTRNDHNDSHSLKWLHYGAHLHCRGAHWTKCGDEEPFLEQTESGERQIINNRYSLPIRDKENQLSSKNRISIDDIKHYVIDSTSSNNCYCERFHSMIKIYINNNDDIFRFRKILIYRFLDYYFFSFFSFYFLNYMINTRRKQTTSIRNTKVEDFLYIFLVNFEKHIEMIINSYVKKKWKLNQTKSHNPFDPFLLYRKKYSIIHRYLIMNISPLNNYNIDFEKKYNLKKGEPNFSNTPFYIKLEHLEEYNEANGFNVLTFYIIIFQSILTHERYYYPYFAALNYQHLGPL